MTDPSLTGKLVLVTSSTAGIGYATCEALTREGVRVIVNDRSQESVGATVVRPNAGGGSIFISLVVPSGGPNRNTGRGPRYGRSTISISAARSR